MLFTSFLALLSLSIPIDKERTPAEILAEIRSNGNKVRVEVFEELARQKTPEAFRALVEGAGIVSKSGKTRAAYGSFKHFLGVPRLEAKAVGFLAESAQRFKKERGINAALALKGLLPASGGHLVDLALDPPTPETGTAVLLGLVEGKMRLEEKDLSRMARSKALPVRYEALLEVTRRIEDEARREQQIVKLVRSKKKVERLVGVELLATIDLPGRFELLAARLGDEYAPVARKAISALVRAHDMRAVGVLVARLGKARKGEVYRISRALERLTGLALGTRPETWARWYEAEGDTFELPSSPVEPKRGPEPKRGGPRTSAFYGLPIHAEQIVFAIDSSESMKKVDGRDDGSRRIDIAKGELTGAIESFDKTTTFDIVNFGAGARSWQGELIPANRRNKGEAVDHVERMSLSWGTEIYGGLREAFVDPAADTIMFLTDGDPQLSVVMDRALTRRLVGQWNRTRHTTIDCLSIGTERQWLRRLALDSGGRYLRIE